MWNPASDIVALESTRDRIHDRALLYLTRKLESDPHNVNALMTLGEVYRAKGNFAAALNAYRRARLLRGPDRRKALWLSAMLGGDRIPYSASRRLWPAPFVRITDFLSPAEHRRVVALALAMRERFLPVRISVGSNRKVRTSQRIGFAIERVADDELDALFVPRIRSMLPDVLERFRLETTPSSSPRIYADMVMYPNGGFVIPHTDGLPSEHRQQSLVGVYYFHRSPKAFSGGDLLLYDTDPKTGRFLYCSFSRVTPVANSMVMYPGCYYHEVTPVACRPDEFADGRFSLNYFVRRPKPQSVA